MKRKLLVAGPVALVVVIALVAFLAWPRGGTAVTEDEALDNFRSDQSASTTSDDAGSAEGTEGPSAVDTTPTPGVYSFATTGQESVKLGPLPAETRDYPDIVPGETTFRLAVNGRAAGIYVITYRSPTINPVLRTFEIKGAVRDASGAAVPGAMADVTLVFETRQGIGVPTAAVLARGGREVVFVARDGTAVQTAVTTGLQNDGWTEIRSGLEPGVQVVSEGQTQLHDGAPVDIR